MITIAVACASIWAVFFLFHLINFNLPGEAKAATGEYGPCYELKCAVCGAGGGTCGAYLNNNPGVMCVDDPACTFGQGFCSHDIFGNSCCSYGACQADGTCGNVQASCVANLPPPESQCESSVQCPQPSVCPDGTCGANETCSSCSQDCGSCGSAYCGDNLCNGTENCSTCVADCGACGPLNARCTVSPNPVRSGSLYVYHTEPGAACPSGQPCSYSYSKPAYCNAAPAGQDCTGVQRQPIMLTNQTVTVTDTGNGSSQTVSCPDLTVQASPPCTTLTPGADQMRGCIWNDDLSPPDPDNQQPYCKWLAGVPGFSSLGCPNYASCINGPYRCDVVGTTPEELWDYARAGNGPTSVPAPDNFTPLGPWLWTWFPETGDNPLQGTLPPHLIANGYASWKGNFTLRPGNYTFFLGSDDASRLFIDGALVIDSWSEHLFTYLSASRTYSTQAQHTFQVDYYQAAWGSNAGLHFYWQRIPGLSTTLSAIPSSGTGPLSVILTADPTYDGSPSDPINYSFWWNCSNTGTNVALVSAACGALPAPSAGSCASNANGYKCSGVLSDPQSSNPNTYNVGNYTAKVIVERGVAPSVEARTAVTVTNPPAVCDWTLRQPPGNGLTPSQPVGIFIPSGNTSQFANSVGMAVQGTNNLVYRQNCTTSGSNCNWSGSWVEINPTAGQTADSAPYTAVSGSGWEVYVRNGNGATNRYRNINGSVGWSGWAQLSPNQSYGTPTFTSDGLGRTWVFSRDGSSNVLYQCALLLPPYVVIDWPAPSATVNGSGVAILGWALDNSTRLENPINPLTVGVYIDGVFNGNAIYGISNPSACPFLFPADPRCSQPQWTNVGYSYFWDSTSVPNGSHTIQVCATDTDPITPKTGCSPFKTVTTDNPTFSVSLDCPPRANLNLPMTPACTATATRTAAGAAASVTRWDWTFQNGSPSSASVITSSLTNSQTTTFTATGSKTVVAILTENSAPPKQFSATDVVDVSQALPRWREILPR